MAKEELNEIFKEIKSISLPPDESSNEEMAYITGFNAAIDCIIKMLAEKQRMKEIDKEEETQ